MDESIVKKYGNKAKAELVFIFDECLKEGYAEGRKDCSEAKVEGYYEGFQQLWDCFRNYTEMNQEERFKAVGYINFQELFDNLTPTWFVDKIKKFEEQKKAEEEIKVGDEVLPIEPSEDVVIVTRKWRDDYGSPCIDTINRSGKTWNYLEKDVHKTGKHFDVEKILKSMGEK